MSDKRRVCLGEITETGLKAIEEYLEKQKRGEGAMIVIEPADFEDMWKLVLEYLVAFPQESNITEWIQEKLAAGGLEIDELQELQAYRSKKL